MPSLPLPDMGKHYLCLYFPCYPTLPTYASCRGGWRCQGGRWGLWSLAAGGLEHLPALYEQVEQTDCLGLHVSCWEPSPGRMEEHLPPMPVYPCLWELVCIAAQPYMPLPHIPSLYLTCLQTFWR